MLQTKTIAFIALAAILVTGLTVGSVVPIPVSVQTVDAKKPVKCNNIKILVRVNGVEENKTYTANVTLGFGQKQKSGTAEANETSIVLPVSFKKISPCPPIGTPFGGDVNGTEIKGQISSLNKPNKVTVDLP